MRASRPSEDAGASKSIGRCRGLLATLILVLLAGCAGLASAPSTPRQALSGLAESAARGLLAAPPWPAGQTRDTVILLRPAQVDANLPIGAEALNEALGRALLSRATSPHVLDWAPSGALGENGDQWTLQATLSADAPPLRLSDRTLQPYRLQFVLSHASDASNHWQWQASGALDLDALPGAR
ncbi:hypothetical protein [Salinicola halophilus]|uniref:hypothetical protein n=1 Tax=Salinicola halophilus TaxID=184065 RepID=UPI000DA11C26|nr:hypothetical protein [Salinicola halophilus]